MTSGIYSLRFPDGSMYIGASSNVVARVQTHISWLRKNKGQTVELQSKFDTFGNPEVRTELLCNRNNLSLYERILYDFYKPSLCKR